MKRIILAIVLLFAGLTGMASNGRHTDSIRYLASTMGQNWFVTVDGSINWWQGSDRIPAGNFTTLNGPSFGGGVSVGKWITHSFALRLAYDVNRGKSFINGGHDNLTGIQFLYVDKTQPITVVQDGTAHQYFKTSFMYHNLHGDVMLSPVDLILGYYDNRFFTPVIVIGMGMSCVSEYTFVTKSFIKGESRNFELSFDAGLINNFRMNKNFDINLGLMLSGQRWTSDSWTYEYGASAGGDVRPKFADLNYKVSMGITWNISGNEFTGSRIYELPINYSNEMKEMRDRIEDLEKELDRCQSNANSNQSPNVDTIIQYVNTTELVSYPLSIFFNRDSYQLMSRRDIVNLREIARVATERNWKLRLRGTCDSATATPEYNKRLAENRCNKIKLELMQLGVPESQIIMVPVGGVHELDPTEYDRRVLIELVKEIQ